MANAPLSYRNARSKSCFESYQRAHALGLFPISQRMNKARDECGCTPRLPKPPAIYARCLRRYVNVYSRERVQSLHIHRLMSDFNHLLSASQECSAPSAPDTCLWLQRQPLPGLLLRHSTWRSNLNLSKCCNYSMTNFLVPPKREKCVPV